jgi:hypothetical protein
MLTTFSIPLLGFGVGKPAGCFEQPVVIEPAPRAAPKVGRGTGVNTGRGCAGELQLDIGVEDLLAGGAPGVSVFGAQKLGEVI